MTFEGVLRETTRFFKHFINHKKDPFLKEWDLDLHDQYHLRALVHYAKDLLEMSMV
jgi:hypothetical protein